MSIVSLCNHIASHLIIKGNEVKIQSQFNQLASEALMPLPLTHFDYKK